MIEATRAAVAADVQAGLWSRLRRRGGPWLQDLAWGFIKKPGGYRYSTGRAGEPCGQLVIAPEPAQPCYQAGGVPAVAPECCTSA